MNAYHKLIAKINKGKKPYVSLGFWGQGKETITETKHSHSWEQALPAGL